jgi:glycosyltransferase XagB
MLPDSSSHFLRLKNIRPERFSRRLLSESSARRYGVVPLGVRDNHLQVACINPFNRDVLHAVSVETRYPVDAYLATYPEIRTTLDEYYETANGDGLAPQIDREHAVALLGYARSGDAPTGSAAANIPDSPDGRNQLEVFSWQHYLPHLAPGDLEIQAGLAALVPEAMANSENILPLWWCDQTLVLGTCGKHHARNEFALVERLGVPVMLVMLSQPMWERLFRKLYLHGQPKINRDEPIARLLVEQGALTAFDLDTSLMINRQTRTPLDRILVDQGLITMRQWIKAKASYYKLPAVPETKLDQWLAISTDALAVLPGSIARQFSVLPLSIENKKNLLLGVESPDPVIANLVEAITGLTVKPQIVERGRLLINIQQCYPVEHHTNVRITPQLSSLLVAMGLITPERLKQTIQADLPPTMPLADRLRQLGYMDDLTLARVLSIQSGIPYATFAHARFDPAIAQMAPGKLVRKHLMFPLLVLGGDLWVAVADPFDGEGLKEIEAITGLRVWPVIAPRGILSAAIDRFYDRELFDLDRKALDLIQVLIEQNYLSHEGASAALRDFGTGMALDRAVLRYCTGSGYEIAKAFANHLHISLLDIDLRERMVTRYDPLGQLVQHIVTEDPIDSRTARLIDHETALRLSALPVSQQGEDLVVAFSDPRFDLHLDELERLVGWKIRPVMVTRNQLDDAIQRILGRRNLGTYLLMDGIISRQQLNNALEYAEKSGIRLGQALLSRGYVTQDVLYSFLARQANLPFVELKGEDIDKPVAQLVPAEVARRLGFLPISSSEGYITLAVVDPFNEQVKELPYFPGVEMKYVIITEAALEAGLEYLYSNVYLTQSISELLERAPDDSAVHVLSKPQTVLLIIMAVVLVFWLVLDYKSCLIFLNALSTIFYLSFSAYRLYLVYHALATDLEIPVSEEEINALQDRDLPIYTILIPVYREAEVLGDLLKEIGYLDYPAAKLDVQVLLEDDDKETIEAFYACNPPAHIRAIVVPTALPKTKPKACNYGLIHARGEYLVIYDAEDLPDRDQLKKMLVAFRKATEIDTNIVCIQAKLNYYNTTQNLLTRWFTAEYSMWFDLFLPGLAGSRAPIPLGGTSNHFKRTALVEAGAWDPYNVTEDADLGLRIFRRGYHTAIVNSTTFEEANSQLRNWIRQRSRWIKGYIQTWLVNMRHPARLIREIGWKGFLSMNFVIGGTFFSALINPIYWILTTAWFYRHWPLIHDIFPGVIYYFGAFCLLFGNFAFVYINVAGALRRGYYGMVKYALLTPLYWGLYSIAAWKALWQLITKPHYWEKTKHGLHHGSGSGPEENVVNMAANGESGSA